jgi:chorismate-pyruvate lyase
MSSSSSYNPIDGFHRENTPGNGTVNGIDFDKLPPILRTLLVSDGTVTKLLEAYFWEPIQVKRLFHGEQQAVGDIPALDLKQGDSVLHRRVLMCGITTGRIYSYAQSYIRADLLWPGVRDDLVQGRLGIGELLRGRRVETYREPLSYELTPAGELARELEVKEDDLLISRAYRIFVGGAPCIFIVDKFPVRPFS